MERFPYGRAVLCILLVAGLTGLVRVWSAAARAAEKPELIVATFARNHIVAYAPAIPRFERMHGVQVRLQLTELRALRSQLQSAIFTQTEMPDIVELGGFSMGYFTRGPLEDVGFVDLTERLQAEGLDTNIVPARFSLWSSRRHVFGLPHDVHPVMLLYRRDLIERLGIDVNTLRTWDDFVHMGRQVTKDINGDGLPDRYALELSGSTTAQLGMLARQRGLGLFDADGTVIFDNAAMADTLIWCVHQAMGPARIGYDAGSGQSLAQAVHDGLVLFYFCPDWRSWQFKTDMPDLKGTLAMMPLPAWQPGGRRTSCWGGTGIFIAKRCKRQDLAWELVKFLYLDTDELGKRFLDNNIVPPYMPAWNMPALQQPCDYFSGQRIGSMYAALAPETPPEYSSPYSELADTKLVEAYVNAGAYYRAHGDAGLKEYTMAELRRCADYIRAVSARNVFLHPSRRTDGQ